jgi:LmbE family N-acetylglucosaminyl deacetylase
MLTLHEAAGRAADGEAIPFPGGVLLVAPHMDDETLGCGALLAGFRWAGSVHIAFATDGARSPQQGSDRDPASVELPMIRRREALEAMAVLDIDEDHVHFLDLPDGELHGHTARLRDKLHELVERLCPAWLLVPFRYDRHPDHLAVNRVAAELVCEHATRRLSVVEYFVYSKWRLLSSGDVRTYLVSDRVVRIGPTEAMSAKKQQALACYRSQTTLFYPWQRRPILTSALRNRVCTEAEIFVVHAPASFERAVFARSRAWIPVAHRIEPVLKRGKDRLVEWLVH